jgi:hypothetical protein
MRYDAGETPRLQEMALDSYDKEEEYLCDVMETKEQDKEVVSQAAWARRQLSQRLKVLLMCC